MHVRLLVPVTKLDQIPQEIQEQERRIHQISIPRAMMAEDGSEFYLQVNATYPCYHRWHREFVQGRGWVWKSETYQSWEEMLSTF